MISHRKYMELALKIAEKGKGNVSPNPLVGALIVKRGRIVGRGWHKKCGEAHAEICALREAGKKAKAGIMYVTLEPCSHWGRTPPCTEQIVDAGVREVVIAMKDPNPKVNGYSELKFRGVKTRIGIFEEEANKLNEPYMKWIKSKKPFVVVKAAMSLDGQIATRTGDSKYIIFVFSDTTSRMFDGFVRSMFFTPILNLGYQLLKSEIVQPYNVL